MFRLGADSFARFDIMLSEICTYTHIHETMNMSSVLLAYLPSHTEKNTSVITSFLFKLFRQSFVFYLKVSFNSEKSGKNMQQKHLELKFFRGWNQRLE